MAKNISSSSQYIDLMGEFWLFFERTAGLTLDEKVDIFKKTIIEPNLAFYSFVVGISDDGLKQYIAEMEPKIASLISSQDQVLQRYQACLNRFQNQFPGFQAGFKPYLLPSLGLFKGMAIPNQGEVSLLLGIDGLIELGDNSLKGYLTHELFHAFHFQLSPATREGAELAFRTIKLPALWALLWTEGIACYAVRVVYPEIPEEEVLDWSLLLDETRPILPILAKEARSVLTSDLPQDIAGFFYFPREGGSNIPTGCGYYIGMLAASKMASKYPIEKLLQMEDKQLIQEMNLALLEL